jgi:hypothetical protein
MGEPMMLHCSITAEGRRVTEEVQVDSTITIQNDADWEEKIRGNKRIKVVVDPMVFRTADVFLRGSKGIARSPELKHPDTMWNAIASNTDSLCAFFDALILEDLLPMYDYDMTFPPDLDTGKHTLVELCNAHADDAVLVPVTVKEDAYQEVKRAAVSKLGELPEIPPAVAADILTELSAFDYEWRPDLWRGEKTGDTQERVLDTFRYGGLLFTGYAQRTGSDHVLQPKRARLYLAMSLVAERVDDEKALYAELMKLANEAPEGVQRTGDLPAAPTFLPYLLRFDDSTPEQLLNRALKLRKSGVIGEYRGWRQNVMADIDKGRALTERRKEISRIASAIARELKVENDSPIRANAKISAKVSAIGPEVGGEVGVEKELNLAAALGWILRNIPGYRYRKLLMRMVIAQREYWHLDRHLKRIWTAS